MTSGRVGASARNAQEAPRCRIINRWRRSASIACNKPATPHASSGSSHAPASPPALCASSTSSEASYASRRDSLLVGSLLPLALAALPAAAKPLAPPGIPIPQEIQTYWDAALALIKSQIGEDFLAQLVLYSSKAELPSGSPGDPAKDYRRSRGSAACQPYVAGDGGPYPFCPAPGQPAASDDETECCRHFAYAVPYSKLALAHIDRASAVVLSPRVLQLPPQRWQAILAHELGHCVDFWLFGDRYALLRHAATAHMDHSLRQQLLAIDTGEADPEVRADLLGELLVLQRQGRKLCYDAALRLQLIVHPSEPCDGEGSSVLMRHYTHAPLAGASMLRGSQGRLL